MKKLTMMITTVFALLFILYSVIFSVITNNVVFNAVNDETKNNMLGTVATLRPAFRLLDESDVSDKTSQWDDAKNAITQTLNPNERIAIYDVDENPIYSFGNEKLIAIQPSEATFEDAKQVGNNTAVKPNDEGKITYAYMEKIYNNKNEVIGYLQISRFITDISHIQQQLLLFSIIASVSIVVILFILLFLYFRRLSLPIQTINRQLDKLAVGDYSDEYTPMRLNEFDMIGENVNALSDNLQQQNFQIQMQDERLSLMVDSMILGVLLIESDRRITLANPAVYHILSIDESVISKTFTSVLTSFRLIQMIEKSFKDRVPLNEEIYLYHPKEMVLDVNVIFVDDHDNDEMNEQVIVLIYDITDIRRLEKIRTDFIANASHELKTPVTALQGFSETLLEGAIDDKDTAIEFVKIMNKESKRLNQLIADILDLAKIEQDQVGHHLEPIDLQMAVDEVVQQVQMEADKKGIHLSTVNAVGSEIIFNSEKGLLNQIITNLVNNAINYTDEKGNVTIVIDDLENNVQIQVIDTGIGIPEDDLPRIFERFYRVSKSRSTSSGGTGLGLSIVRNIVQSLGGRIDVMSQLNEGSEFRVLLPKNTEE